jgi:hypothetical protein
MDRPFRIVHAAQFEFNQNGARYYNNAVKLDHGLVQLGHMVYQFSFNDIARMHSPLNSKSFGKSAINRGLVESCRNVKPEMLLIGHGHPITNATLEECKTICPGLKTGLWYIDPLWVPADVAHLHHKQPLLDAIFATSAGPLLANLASNSCHAAYFPNPVHPAIEADRTFEKPDGELEYDLTFIGSDKRAPERRQFLLDIKNGLKPPFRLGIFGSLGQPPVFGEMKEHVLTHTRMALNLSRRNDVLLYSSDRMAQNIGNGILVFCPDSTGFESLFTKDEVVYFSDAEDLVEKAKQYAADDALCRETARRGWEKIHSTCSSKAVAAFMIDVIFRNNDAEKAGWPVHIHTGPSGGSSRQ